MKYAGTVRLSLKRDGRKHFRLELDQVVAFALGIQSCGVTQLGLFVGPSCL